MSIQGTAGDDRLDGTPGADTFSLGQGGNDTATGEAGDDRFNLIASLTAADKIDGGADRDMVVVKGDYSAGVTFNAATMTNVEVLRVSSGFSYDFTTHNATVAAGTKLTVDAGSLALGETLTFNGAAETNGRFEMIGGADNDTLTGGSGADLFDLSNGGNDTASGGGGKDLFTLGAALTAADTIDGGTGADEVRLSGNYSALVFGATTMTNVESLQLAAGSDYSLTTNDATVAAGQTLRVNASTLGSGDTVSFDGSAETDGRFMLLGGAGNDTLTGGKGADFFELTPGGTDTVTAGEGDDVIVVGAGLTAADSIDGGLGADRVRLSGNYGGLVFGPSTMTNIESLHLAAGSSYNFTTNDATVAAGGMLTVNALALGAGDTLTLYGAAETDGRFKVIGGAGDDAIHGGARADIFDISRGGNDIVVGRGGGDTFAVGGALTAADLLNGGAGSDTIQFNGDYSGGHALVLGATTVTNVETFTFATGFDYDITTNDATVTTGHLSVDASHLAAGDDFSFDGSAETDSGFVIAGGASLLATYIGGALGDSFFLTAIPSAGNITIDAGGGNDSLSFAGNFDSSGQTIDGGAGNDQLLLDGDYTSISLVGSGIIDNIEKVFFNGGHSYTGIQIFDDVSGGAVLTLDASFLGAGDSFEAVATNSATSIAFLAGAGTYSVTGSEFNDTFTLGAGFASSDSVNGGSGNDTVTLQGDYSAGLTLAAATVTKVETLLLGAGNSYDLTTNNGNVGSGKTLTVDASALGSGNTLTFDGSAETNGTFDITGGAGNDNLTGGQFGDDFDLSAGGVDTVHAGAGINTVYMGAALTAADTIDGGAGLNEVELDGDYTGGHAVTFTASTITNVFELDVDDGNSYDLTANDANVAAGSAMIVDATVLTAGHSLTFDGSAELDGSFFLNDGEGNDTLTGGAQADDLSFDGGGTDTGNGGGGDDFVDACGHLDSTDQFDGGTGYDTLELTADETASGNYTGADALHLTAAMVANFEEVDLDDGGSYDITTVDATVASGVTFAVDASFLTAGNSLTFDGSAELDGSFLLNDGAGNDILTGGAQQDELHFDGGGTDIGNGGGGDDVFYLGGQFDATDRFDGGAGTTNVMHLSADETPSGNYTGADALHLTATMLTNFRSLYLADGGSYDITTVDATVAAGKTFVVDGTLLSSTYSLNFDGSAETNGFFIVNDGAGDDTITGGSRVDVFGLYGGGNDTVHAGAGGDFIDMRATLTAADSIDGGDDSDTLVLRGDYSAGISFTASTVQNIETVLLSIGYSYNIELNASTVAAGHSITIDGTAVGGGNSMTIGFDTLGGGGASYFMRGGAGDDVFNMLDAFTASDRLDGGTGNDAVNLDADYSAGVTLNNTTITNIDLLGLAAGHSYRLTTADGNVASGATLSVAAGGLGAADTLIFDGSAETNGFFDVTGGAGNDTLKLSSAAVLAGSTFSAGSGNDTLELNGDFSGGVTLTASTLSGVDTLKLDAGHSYSLTTNDGDVASGATLTVDGSALGPADVLTFDGTAESDGALSMIGGAGNDVLTGGAKNDTFDLSQGGNDTVHAGEGLDTLNYGSKLTSSDTVDGGAGNDTLSMSGAGYSDFLFGALTSIEQIVLGAGFNYGLSTVDADVASGANLAVNGAALGAANSLTLSGFAETDGFFAITGGAGNDTLGLSTAAVLAGSTYNGGAGSDILELAGDFSGGVTLGASSLSGVETLRVDAGHSYSLTTNDANVAAAATLIVDASTLGAGNTLTFDGTAESDGNFAVTGGAGNDTLKLRLPTVLASSTFNGGAGNDTLELNGPFFSGVTLGASTLSSVETLKLDSTHSYTITTNDANVAAAATLTVDASALGAGNVVIFDGTAETDGKFAVTGGAGDDTVKLGRPTVVANSTFNGGAGNDTLELNGPFFSGVTLGAATLSSVETIKVDATHSYTITTNDANVASGAPLTVDASALGAGNVLIFDGSAETDGSFAIVGGAGDDVLTGGSQSDAFDLSHGGNDTAHGGGGNDTFSVGAALTAADTLDGSTGSDTLALNGDYSAGLTFGAGVTSIEKITVAAGNSYKLTSILGNFDSGATVTVDASALGSTDQLTFNGSAETGAHFAFIDGQGGDTFTGGSQSDTFDLTHMNNSSVGDTANGGGGNDTFTIAGLTGNPGIRFAFDTVNGGSGSDTLVTGNIPTGASINATNYTSIENIDLSGDGDQLTVIGDVAGGGQTLNIVMADGGTLFKDADLSQATSTLYNVTTGTSNGTVNFAANFNVNDHLTGAGVGVAWDILSLNGDYTGGNALVFNATTMTGFQTVTLGDAGSYNITLNDATIANGSELDFDATQMVTAGHVLTLTDTAETNGSIGVMGSLGDDVIHCGAGDDSLQGSAGNDILDGGTGGAQMDGGAGQDTITVDATNTLQNFTYDAVADSTGSDYDIITGINFNFAQFIISGFDPTKVLAIDAAVNTGTLDTGANFDTDLAAAINAAHLAAHHAVLFTPNASSTGLAGTSFIVVDVNGTAGYQAGADLVIDIGTTHVGNLSAGEFI